MVTPTGRTYTAASGADLYAGRSAALSLPSWVPAPNGVTTLSVSNGRLTNNFRDARDPYYSGFDHIKTCNDFSTSVVVEDYGTNGMVVWFGGGHAGTNCNTVTGLPLEEVCTFRNLVPGTPYEGTGTDGTTQSLNGQGNQNDQLDFETAVNTVDNKPAAPHSYGAVDAIRAADGGAAHGTVSIIVIPAANRTNDGGSASSWKIDFDEPGSAFYAWERRGTDFKQLMQTDGTPTVEAGSSYAAPNWTCYVPAQNRTYWECNSFHSPRWKDNATNTYVLTGTGAQRPRAPDNADSGMMVHVPERDLLLFFERSSGVLRIHRMSVGVADTNPGWHPTAITLSTPIPVASEWSAVCWCPDSQRLIVGMQTSASLFYGEAFTTSSVIEIAIPATLTNTWPVEDVPIDGVLNWINAGNVLKKWSYNTRAKCIAMMQVAQEFAGDVVQIYRPRNT